MSAYAHPEVLVDTEWVAHHMTDPKVRIAEVDYDPAANYRMGHIPGSVLVDWRQDINDPTARDLLSGAALTKLFHRAGIHPDTTLVLYGDFNNWFAAFAFWVFKYYGVKNLKIMNGGRKKWIEEDKALTKDVSSYFRGDVNVSEPDQSLRAYYDDVKSILGNEGYVLVDVRGPKEF